MITAFSGVLQQRIRAASATCKSSNEWVDDPNTTADDLDALATPDEAAWLQELEAVRLYA